MGSGAKGGPIPIHKHLLTLSIPEIAVHRGKPGASRASARSPALESPTRVTLAAIPRGLTETYVHRRSPVIGRSLEREETFGGTKSVTNFEILLER